MNSDLKALASKLPEVLLTSKATNTYKSYNYSFRDWCKWCNRYKLSPVPSSDYHVSLFIISLMQAGCSSSKIDQVVYAIKWAHQIVSEPVPCDSFLVKSISEGAKRMLSKPSQKKEPVTPEILLELVQRFGHSSNLYDKRTVTMCLLAYAGFLRFSELANLKACDVKFSELFVTLFIEKSKTDQHREGHYVVIAKVDSPACPVKMLKEYLALAEIDDEEENFLFRQLSFCHSSNSYKLRKSGHLSYTRVRELFLEKLHCLGLDTTKFGLHSLRSGGATAAANAGISDRLFKKHGRWRSDRAKDGYVKENIHSLLSVSKNLGL
ncbi:hypothetical protein FSP39_012523 [Pinctada imbricata]|uniref:Tyr recombinase domain-containing protein n=1 Tax=Pinctada imbricata TaxID=66713 RepID=A0AA88XZ50_PINIB|nr:hypothetical protein FSP39_012523 [Pinctada imbricata]